MSNDLNRCDFIGRLGRDPESRYLQDGKQVCNFSIACGRSWKTQDGEKKEDTEWVRIVVWGKLAEICQEYLTKGSRVFISGRLRTRKWQDRDGQDRYTTEVVLDGFEGRMQMLDSKNSTAAGADASTTPPAHSPQAGTPGTDAGTEGHGGPDRFDDDIPF